MSAEGFPQQPRPGQAGAATGPAARASTGGPFRQRPGPDLVAQLRGSLPGAGAALVAALLGSGLVEHDPADADWPDRDRLVVGGSGLLPAVDTALQQAGYAPGQGRLAFAGGEALAVAFGLAAASALDGGVFATWCLLDESAAADGAVWEAASAAAAAGAGWSGIGGVAGLTALVVGQAAARRAGELLGACGWQVVHADGEDPAAVLSALGRLGGGGRTGPGALVAETAA